MPILDSGYKLACSLSHGNTIRVANACVTASHSKEVAVESEYVSLVLPSQAMF